MEFNYDFLNAYYRDDLADDKTGNGITIMINQYKYSNTENTNYYMLENCEEEYFEGGNTHLAEEICYTFNEMKTKDYDVFYQVRSEVFNKHNFKL